MVEPCLTGVSSGGRDEKKKNSLLVTSLVPFTFTY